MIMARNSEVTPSERWKRHIIRELRCRNRSQTSLFQEIIRSYHSLLEKSKHGALITRGLMGTGSRPSAQSAAVSPEDSLTALKSTTGELAYQVVDLQQKIQMKNVGLVEQHSRLSEVTQVVSVLTSEQRDLKDCVAVMEAGNQLLKNQYDSLLQQKIDMEKSLRLEEMRRTEILEDIMQPKQQAAAWMNHRNERRVRAREARLHRELQMAARTNVNINEASGNVSPPSPLSPKCETPERPQRSHASLFRSASATSPRIFSSIRGLFERKIRGKTVCRSGEDLYIPIGVCLVARVPTRAVFALDAHELGINAVRFSSGSNLLATGGTDRIIKLWNVEAGTLQSKGTLDGSTEGITSIEFNPTGTQVLAGSYDKSALFWRIEDSVPKVTLTGHARKVTAARFKYSRMQVVTGSADRTVKIWDLQRAACLQTIEVLSFCSDVVCSEYLVISSHFDKKIRFWDSRAATCTQEVPLQGRVTSLDLCPNHRQLLSCSRDDVLQLVDLRKCNERMAFRAEGFKCASDSTKAIFSPDGNFLAAGSADSAVYIWNVNTGNLETRLPGMHSAPISAVAWSLSGDYVVSVDKSRRAVLWSDM
ncbi:hypothetical protein DNTS_006349 [Danionella cerebrum]|uniref:Autophagy-related protein 16 domain-containing protein n=1 Tax=Danionella cerebrum TaxID=2873325 RepID=A0A553Q5F4_9TELE|nr:hypothetical protein DNTS_006349 [Danionella translucida]